MQDQTTKVQKLLKIVPLDYVLKYDPPLIGLVYKVNENESKKRLYQIYLRDLILENDAKAITEKLFEEHKLHLNPAYVSPDQIKTLVRKLLDNYNKRRLQAGMFGAGKASSNTSNQGANNSANAQQKTSGGAKFEFENFDSLKAKKGFGETDDKLGTQDFRITNEGLGETTTGQKAESSSKYKVTNPKNLLAADDLGIDLDEDFEIDEFDGF